LVKNTYTALAMMSWLKTFQSEGYRSTRCLQSWRSNLNGCKVPLLRKGAIVLDSQPLDFFEGSEVVIVCVCSRDGVDLVQIPRFFVPSQVVFVFQNCMLFKPLYRSWRKQSICISVVTLLVRLGARGQGFFTTVETYTRSPPAYEMKVESCPQSGIPPPASSGQVPRRLARRVRALTSRVAATTWRSLEFDRSI
jgi:hypothetical protein